MRIANASFVPQPEPSIPDDTDPMGVWIHLAEAADVVYASLAAATGWLQASGATNVEAFDEGFSQAIAYVMHGHRCVVFRGTQQPLDWVMDGLCFYWGSPPRHFGFHRGWTNIREKVQKWLSSTKSTKPGVFLAGHSLGAAIAVIAAMDLADKGVDIERVVLFGCPRVGSPEFAAKYDRLGLTAKTRRFQHLQDGVCVIPPRFFYSHVADVHQLSGPALPALGPSGLLASQQEPAGPNMLFAVISVIPGFAEIGHILLQALSRDRENKWWNPEKTSLGKRNVLLGYAIFLLVLIAARLLMSRDEASVWLNARIAANLPLLLFAALMEALILQQVWYGVLWRVPAMARLLISVCLTALVLWWFPLRQIDAVAMPLLIVLAAALFLTAYAFGGGVPDHPMDYYIAALSASPARRLATDLFNRDVARRTDEFVESQVEFARNNPEAAAQFREALDRIKKSTGEK